MEEKTMYKVYKIESAGCYAGISLVAANSVEEANLFINKFKESDKNNISDSFGYCEVEESDEMDGIFSEYDGIVYFGIRYTGIC